jgi:peptidoglycan hydrolase-like protein with peptidoglycan-binding domain
LAGIALAALAGAAGWALSGDDGARGEPRAARAVATGTATVVRTAVAARQQVGGTLGYGGAHDVVATGQGTLTWLPRVGSVVARGGHAYEIDGALVVLLYGRRPAWRALQLGMTDGADVRQLETNLKALGYGDDVTVDEHFSAATYWAVRDWQRDADLAVAGSVPLGQIVFVPAAVRVSAHDVKLGSQVQPGTLVAHGTGAHRAVTVQLAPGDLPRVQIGDRVIVTLPDGATRRGKITAVGAVAVSTSSGDPSGGEPQATVPVTIEVTGRIRGFLDQAPVQVAITAERHKAVLAVPTTALRALAGGRYEVIVLDGPTLRHVPVQTGLFDEVTGLAEVAGSGLSEGQKVEVPRDRP